jgi:hypothetical protein
VGTDSGNAAFEHGNTMGEAELWGDAPWKRLYVHESNSSDDWSVRKGGRYRGRNVGGHHHLNDSGDIARVWNAPGNKDGRVIDRSRGFGTSILNPSRHITQG